MRLSASARLVRSAWTTLGSGSGKTHARLVSARIAPIPPHIGEVHRHETVQHEALAVAQPLIGEAGRDAPRALDGAR